MSTPSGMRSMIARSWFSERNSACSSRRLCVMSSTCAMQERGAPSGPRNSAALSMTSTTAPSLRTKRLARDPPALLEVAARLRRTPDVVLLLGAAERPALFDHLVEQSPQTAGPGRLGIGGVVGEHVEDAAPHDRVTPGQGGARVRFAG